jgi:hypothetical protein
MWEKNIKLLEKFLLLSSSFFFFNYKVGGGWSLSIIAAFLFIPLPTTNRGEGDCFPRERDWTRSTAVSDNRKRHSGIDGLLRRRIGAAALCRIGNANEARCFLGEDGREGNLGFHHVDPVVYFDTQ